MISCESTETSSSTEEYCKKVAREAKMDVDPPAHSPSWAEQMELEVAILALKQIDFVNALPTQEQAEIEYDFPAQTSLPAPHVEPMPSSIEHEVSTPLPIPSTDTQMDVSPSIIPYDINAPADTSLWDVQLQALSIFGIKETFNQDITNIVSSLERAAAYINQRDLKDNDPNSVELFHKFGNAVWLFLSAVYSSKWDRSLTNDNVSFRNRVFAQFKGGQYKKSKTNTPTNPSQVDSPKAQVSRIPPPILPRLPGGG